MTKDLFSIDAYHYDLPSELIAQHPCSPRHDSRLLIVDRKKESFREIRFIDLCKELEEGDSFVFNNTKVIPARLFAKRSSGAKIQIFLHRHLGKADWEVLAKPARKVLVGETLYLADDMKVEVIGAADGGVRQLRFSDPQRLESFLETHGQIPLPHYIRNGQESPEDRENYQTMYAKHSGAVAAPTAGLHFSKEMLGYLQEKKIYQTEVTLHVGLGTFKPVQADDIREHSMHNELFILDEKAVRELENRDLKRRQIVVGTTSCRALESAVDFEGHFHAGTYETDIFIYPGYKFRYVEALLTNFHLPKSTLLMLISAFAGYDLVMEAYRYAVKERFRFFSYGDAMLLL